MDQARYEEAVEKSLCSYGNNYRLKTILEKTQKKEITIAFLGGSVTQGWDGEKILTQSYSVLLHRYLCNKYPMLKINYVNMALASENSFLGLSITDKYITGINPDIVIVEYAVNNECGSDHITAYESLIRRLLDLPQSPAVISVFMINSSFYTCQAYMKKVGENYDLPMVSVADSLKMLLDSDEIQWNLYSPDFAHPSIWGHRFIADCMINLFEKISQSEPDISCSEWKPLYGVDYSDYCALDPERTKIKLVGFEPVKGIEQFDNALATTKNVSGGAVIRFEASFRHLFIAYMHDREVRYADAQVFVDNTLVDELQGSSVYGWNNPVIKKVCSFSSCENHIVELRVKNKKLIFIAAEFGLCQ
ncbi:MAG: SGNH/GDSL hydrolase family protein [Oscillospiraceae bacterium]|nr:SGNH/GDSL hydrolase family protein [Oscillospiraceae bacterium]